MTSPPEGPSSDGVLESAAIAREWALLISQRALTPEERDSFESWLENPQHETEFILAFEIRCRYEDDGASGSAAEPMEVQRRLSSRATLWRQPRVFSLAAGLILVVCASFLMLPDHPAFSTGVGERISASLPDGTHVDLNSQTALKWVGDRCDRRVRLINGEAWFVVQHRDAKCPFTVVVDRNAIDVLGTQFDVYRRKDGTFEVLVLEGRVSLHGPGAAMGLNMNAGQRVTWRDGSQPSAQPVEDPGKMGSWRQGRIDFDNQPLATVVEELQRYTRVPIRIADRRLFAIHVTSEMLIDPQHIRESIRRLASPQIVVKDDGTSITLALNPRASDGLQ